MIHIPERKLSNEELLLEFDDHRKKWQASPTALVSTTTNFLRVIHLAFEQLHQRESADQIQILFIMPDDGGHAKLHSGKDLASQLCSLDVNPQHYQYEYLFEWQIPESSVLHEITMATLIRRGFTLRSLCGQTVFTSFPDMKAFQDLIRVYWEGVCLNEKGYHSGMAACHFGFNAVTSRLAEEFLDLFFASRGYGNYFIDMGVEDALYSCASSIGDGLAEFTIELSDLHEALAALNDAHIVEVGEMVDEYFDDSYQLGNALDVVKTLYQRRREGLEKRLAEVYLEIGY